MLKLWGQPLKEKYMIFKLVEETKVRQNLIHLIEGKNEIEKKHSKNKA